MTDALESRTGLPDALRILLTDYPRDAWDADPNFSGLIRFWLDRHLMFRRLQAAMEDVSQRAIDRDLDGAGWARQFSRLGSTFVGELHGHHSIEDLHYFPKLKDLDPRISRGFEILDRDHHALDGHLNAFAENANAALQAAMQTETRDLPDAVAKVEPTLADMRRFLDRHLTDEEELVVPILLRHAPAGLT